MRVYSDELYHHGVKGIDINDEEDKTSVSKSQDIAQQILNNIGDCHIK